MNKIISLNDVSHKKRAGSSDDTTPFTPARKRQNSDTSQPELDDLATESPATDSTAPTSGLDVPSTKIIERDFRLNDDPRVWLGDALTDSATRANEKRTRSSMSSAWEVFSHWASGTKRHAGVTAHHGLIKAIIGLDAHYVSDERKKMAGLKLQEVNDDRFQDLARLCLADSTGDPSKMADYLHVLLTTKDVYLAELKESWDIGNSPSRHVILIRLGSVYRALANFLRPENLRILDIAVKKQDIQLAQAAIKLAIEEQLAYRDSWTRWLTQASRQTTAQVAHQVHMGEDRISVQQSRGYEVDFQGMADGASSLASSALKQLSASVTSGLAGQVEQVVGKVSGIADKVRTEQAHAMTHRETKNKHEQAKLDHEIEMLERQNKLKTLQQADTNSTTSDPESDNADSKEA